MVFQDEGRIEEGLQVRGSVALVMRVGIAGLVVHELFDSARPADPAADEPCQPKQSFVRAQHHRLRAEELQSDRCWYDLECYWTCAEVCLCDLV